MKLDNVTRDDWVLAGVALLLVIDLLLLPWFDVSIGPISVTSTATGTPDGWLGVLAVLASLALIADIGVERLSPASRVPALGGNRTTTRLALAVTAAFFVALKFLFHVHFSLFGFGFWAGVVLTVGLVVLATRARQGESLLSSPQAGSQASAGPARPAPPSA
jgi:hypothetical protein